MKVAAVQLSVGPVSSDNLATTLKAIDDAATTGACFIVTPEATNYLRSHQSENMPEPEGEDPHLAAFADKAKQHGAWLMAGSLLLRQDQAAKKLNRQFLWNPQGEPVSTYDKIHMFDVAVGDGQVYAESEHYQAGSKLVISEIDGVKIGHTICYDLRFPQLFQALANKGAEIIVVPAAFTAVTGAAHWHALLRARAIENGCYIIAAGQTGEHDKGRTTYGHSLIIAPTGEVLQDAGPETGIIAAELDISLVAKTRASIPNLKNARDFS